MRRTAETWCATVFSDTKSRSGDLRVAQPFGRPARAPRARAPSARRGSRASRPAARGGTSRAPRSRRARAMRRAAGCAPRRCSSASPAGAARLVVGVAEGERRLVRASHRGPPLGRPAPSRRRARGGTGSATASGSASARPARRRHRQSSPTAQRCGRSSASAASVSPAIAPSRPASQRASARAAATGRDALHLAHPARARAPRRAARHASGSPRRARSRPRTVSASDPRRRRDVGRRQDAAAAVAAPASQRPWSSSERARQPAMYAPTRSGRARRSTRSRRRDGASPTHSARIATDPAPRLVYARRHVLLQPGLQRELEAALELRRRPPATPASDSAVPTLLSAWTSDLGRRRAARPAPSRARPSRGARRCRSASIRSCAMLL